MRLETFLLVGLAAVAVYLVMKPKQPVVVMVASTPQPAQASPSQTTVADNTFNNVLRGIEAATKAGKTVVDTITSAID